VPDRPEVSRPDSRLFPFRSARTWVTLTKAGQAALEDEIAQLKLLISRIESAGTSPS
jgi:hypothetical protein